MSNDGLLNENDVRCSEAKRSAAQRSGCQEIKEALVLAARPIRCSLRLNMVHVQPRVERAGANKDKSRRAAL